MTMTDALSMYKGVLFEINQFQSAAFDVEDFNYWIQEAVNKWLEEQLKEYEKTQIIADKISCLVKKSNVITINVDNSTDLRQFDVPEDYRHLLNCLLTLRYKQATPSYSVSGKRKVYTKRYTGDNEASFMEDYYLRPLVSDSDHRVYHRSLGNKVSIMFDTAVYPNPSVVLESAVIEYFIQPLPIELGVDYSIEQDTPFAEHANREIVKICATLFLENEQSQRLQSHAEINN